MTGFLLDDELRSFVMGANSVVLATRSAALVPNAARACGLRVLGPDRIDLLLPRDACRAALANLRENGDIAVCVASPRNYRALQLKGRFIGAAEASDEDRLLSEAQFREFAALCVEQGVSRQMVRNLWLFESWRVEVRITSAFVQTPGPGAGETMDAPRGR